MTNEISSPLFTKKDLIALIVPLFIEQLLATTIGMADTIMVSNVGAEVVSAVGLVDSLSMLLISLFSAIATGVSVVVSQYIGSKDKENANNAANQSLLAAIIVSVIITLICLLGGNNLLILLFGKSEQIILDNAAIYLKIVAISYLFLAVQTTCSAIFRSIRKSKVTMYVSLLMNLINICGNAFFIFGLNMGVAGAGLATLISRIVGAVIMITLLLNPKSVVNLRNFFPLKFDFDILRKIFSIGIPAGTETLIFRFGKVLTQGYITGFGTPHMSANTICGNLFNLTNMPGSALNLAIVTIVGQCVGAERYKEAKNYVIKLWALSSVVLAFTNITLYLNADFALSLYDTIPEAVPVAKSIILFAAFAQTFFWSPAFVIPNALRASGDANYTMKVSIGCMWVFRVGIGYILAIQMQLGALGVWLAMFIDWIFRGIFFGYRLFSNKWINKKVV